jgi:hypothetical protein
MDKKHFTDGTEMPNKTILDETALCKKSSDKTILDKTVADKVTDKVVGDEKIVEGKTKFAFGEKNGYTEEQVIELLRDNPENYRLYTRLNGGWKKRFMDYMICRRRDPRSGWLRPTRSPRATASIKWAAFPNFKKNTATHV